MGTLDGHARQRRPSSLLAGVVHLHLLLVAALQVRPPPGASAGRLPPPCPAYCVCNVTVELFFMVTCVRASLNDVPRALPRKESTTVLDLQQNELHKLRESSLDGFSQLQFLYLNDTQLKEISEKAFHQCPELRSVFLSGNELKQIPSMLFKTNHRLQFVDLSRNPLFLPPQAPFLVSRSLLILNLTNTRLSEVPPVSLTGLPQLKLLDLSANLLRRVELQTVNFLRNATLLLHDNPLHCDCILWRTWRWQQSTAPPTPTTSPTELQEDSPLCNEPETLRGISLNVMVNRLSCDKGAALGLSAEMYVMIGVAALLAVAVVALAAVTAVRWRTRKRHAAAGGGRQGLVWCRPKRLAPPVGEYIEVVPDITATKKPVEQVDAIYETVEENKRTGSRAPTKSSEGSGSVAVRDPNEDRYVSEFTRCTYVPPSVPARFDEPLYVNMKGPPLPERGCSNEDSSSGKGAPPPAPPSPQPPRPCSVPLLEGCDFYEVVD